MAQRPPSPAAPSAATPASAGSSAAPAAVASPAALARPRRATRVRPSRRGATAAARAKAFGDFCEATEGLAKAWRRQGWPPDMIDYIYGDVWSMQCAERYFKLARVPIDLYLQFASTRRLLGAMFFSSNSDLALLAARRLATHFIDRLRHHDRRAGYYAAETARRHALARGRRRIARHTTTNPPPSPEQIRDAWHHRKDTPEAMLRFGSLLNDLECYVDNKLKFSDDGEIIGRRGGVKVWLLENVPEIHAHYKTAMRFKAAAKKLRQIVELPEPTPVEAILPSAKPSPRLTRAAERYHRALDGCVKITPAIERLRALLDPNRPHETIDDT